MATSFHRVFAQVQRSSSVSRFLSTTRFSGVVAMPTLRPATYDNKPHQEQSTCLQSRGLHIVRKTTTARDQAVYNSVMNYYGKVLSSSKDLKTSACTTAGAPPAPIRRALAKVPNEILAKYYGCGGTLPLGIEGLSVLDLGSGSGKDCYVAAALVGPTGRVVGVDMTDEQLEVARAHVDEYAAKLGWKPSLEFRKGYIEYLSQAGIANGSIDLCISNCVVNLSPNKELVLRGVYDALSDGGEFFFSDVYVDRRLPQNVREHDVLLGECLGGALYINDFLRLCAQVGFQDPREVSRAPIAVQDEELLELLGEAQFYSITYRLVKVAGNELEPSQEDYGQVAKYKGTIAGHRHSFDLDADHHFVSNKPMSVSGNTATLLSRSRYLKSHFQVIGDRRTHFGAFQGSKVSLTRAAVDGLSATTSPSTTSSASSCCPGSGCC